MALVGTAAGTDGMAQAGGIVPGTDGDGEAIGVSMEIPGFGTEDSIMHGIGITHTFTILITAPSITEITTVLPL